MTPQHFPDDWRAALVLVPHPDDPEYGIGAAVAKWTAQGRTVVYALASRGERGIEGMRPEEAGPLREGEQRASAAVVGVDDVRFWEFPDSDIRNTAELRSAIAAIIGELEPDLLITIYSGPEWGPGDPNQRDHIEFARAVAQVWDESADPPRWLFENGPDPTHCETVDGYHDLAVESLAQHRVYLEVLDPDTAVLEQARATVDAATAPPENFGADRAAGFILRRVRDAAPPEAD